MTSSPRIEGVSALDYDDGDVVTLLSGSYGRPHCRSRVTPDDIEIRASPVAAADPEPRPRRRDFSRQTDHPAKARDRPRRPCRRQRRRLSLSAAGILVEEVVARSLTIGDIDAQRASRRPGRRRHVVRDTACFSSNSNFATDISATGTPPPVVLTNVTTVAATGNALAANGSTADVTATNVIASGGTDVNVQNSAEITLDHSNYNSVTELSGGNATNVGENATNQTTAPIFAGATDFHQAANSPTINAGTASAASFGTVDFDGFPRNQGPAPDIGADEVNVDTDGDGVLDVNDACPAVQGPVSNNGCPDADGDGVPDPSDNCPTVSGPASNGGCPLPPADTDGDGIPDASDACPAQAAPGTANGCPAAAPDTRKPQTKIDKGPKGEIEKDTGDVQVQLRRAGLDLRVPPRRAGGWREGEPQGAEVQDLQVAAQAEEPRSGRISLRGPGH